MNPFLTQSIACTLTACAHPTTHTRDYGDMALRHAAATALDNVHVVHAQYVFTSHARDTMMPLDHEHTHTQPTQDHDNTTEVDSDIDYIIMNDSDNNLTNNNLTDNDNDNLTPETAITRETSHAAGPLGRREERVSSEFASLLSSKRIEARLTYAYACQR